MDRVDAHIHLCGDDEATIAMLDELGIRALNICVAHDSWRQNVLPVFRELATRRPERYAWCTTFDLPDHATADDVYQAGVLDSLSRDLADGAVAVKVWKHIGMELRRRNGSFAMIDDRIFSPVFEFLEKEGIPVLAHIGEPLACWLPLDAPSAHASYYRHHPEWHFYGKPCVPDHADLIRARDRLLERHRDLRLVGAHLGSLEYDLSEVASRLDRYPNLAVDTSARLGDLIRQDSGVVHDFFVKYQDRLLFGTDMVYTGPLSSANGAEITRIHESIRATYETWFRYLESREAVRLDGQSARGLGLPTAVVQKVCETNARTWYPRLA